MEKFLRKTLHKNKANGVRTNLLLEADKDFKDNNNISFKINSRTLKEFRKEMEQHLFIEFEEKISSSSTPVCRKDRISKKHFKTICGINHKIQNVLNYHDEINENDNLVDLDDLEYKLKYRKELKERLLSLNYKNDKESSYKSFLFLKNIAFSLKRQFDFSRNPMRKRTSNSNIKRHSQSINISMNSSFSNEEEKDYILDDFDCILKTEEAVGISNNYKSQIPNQISFIQLIPCKDLNKNKSSSFCISLHRCNAN